MKKIILNIPAETELNRWHERSVSVDRGPLNFVLKIDEYGQRTGEEETVTLIPYACSALRISEFPLAGDYSVMR